MIFAKRLSISFAAIATALTMGGLGSDPAQAITITGRITGTWDGDYYNYGYGQGANVNVNVGDTFTADYSYDDATLKYFDNSLPGNYQSSGYRGLLLSLIVNSGSYSKTFDFPDSYSEVYFREESGYSSSYPYSPKYYYSAKYYEVYADDYLTTFNFFKRVAEPPYVPVYNTSSAFAELYTSDNNVGYGVYTNSNVQLTLDTTAVPTPDPTAVPEPALLTGLIGLGVFVLRKRKAEVAKQISEV